MMAYDKSDLTKVSKVAKLGYCYLLKSVQTGSVGAKVANVSPQSTTSGQVTRQCSFLLDSVKL